MTDDKPVYAIHPRPAPRRANPRKNVIMNSPALGLRVASVLFGLAAVGHLIRIVFKVYLQFGSWVVGRRWSTASVIVLAVLCIWMWMLAYTAAKQKTEIAPAKPVA